MRDANESLTVRTAAGALAILALAAALTGCSGKQVQPAQRAAETKPRKFAVLVNGDTARLHTQNIARAFKILLACGFDDRDICILSTEKPIGHQDGLVSRPERQAFTAEMERLAKTVNARDLVIIYGTGHGDYRNGEASLIMRSGNLKASDLRAQVDRIAGRTVVIIDSSHSGGFVDAFKGTPRRVIVISTVGRLHATDCKVFARTFWEAFIHPEVADRNFDGKTSVKEAFDAAIKQHRRALRDEPVYRADGTYRGYNGFEDALLN